MRVGIELTKTKTDSSSALGTGCRHGLGKVRHIARYHLWRQDNISCGEIKLPKCMLIGRATAPYVQVRAHIGVIKTKACAHYLWNNFGLKSGFIYSDGCRPRQYGGPDVRGSVRHKRSRPGDNMVIQLGGRPSQHWRTGRVRVRTSA